jgi:hypothetical protein
VVVVGASVVVVVVAAEAPLSSSDAAAVVANRRPPRRGRQGRAALRLASALLALARVLLAQSIVWRVVNAGARARGRLALFCVFVVALLMRCFSVWGSIDGRAETTYYSS